MIRPLKTFVVIEPSKVNNKTNSGIYIPETSLENPNKGKVIAVGKEVLDVEVDDDVIFNFNHSTEIEYKSKVYLIVNELEIYAKIK